MKFKSFNFDFDDNILRLPTHIIAFNSKTQEELPVSTEEFAIIRSKFGTDSTFEKNGKSFNLKNYGLNGDESFREFRDINDLETNKKQYEMKAYNGQEVKGRKEEYFMKDLKKALESETYAPSWNDFVNACSTKDGANHTTIITARGQSPLTIFEGIMYLKNQGYIKNEVPLENIYPVSHDSIKDMYQGIKGVDPSNPSALKNAIMFDILDKREEKAKSCEKGFLHLCGFSDDDLKTFNVIKDAVKENLHKWPNLDISIFFTKEKRKKHLIKE